jgi:hypothetical protein
MTGVLKQFSTFSPYSITEEQIIGGWGRGEEWKRKFLNLPLQVSPTSTSKNLF